MFHIYNFFRSRVVYLSKYLNFPLDGNLTKVDGKPFLLCGCSGSESKPSDRLDDVLDETVAHRIVHFVMFHQKLK